MAVESSTSLFLYYREMTFWSKIEVFSIECTQSDDQYIAVVEILVKKWVA